jgi:hypothetical protein
VTFTCSGGRVLTGYLGSQAICDDVDLSWIQGNFCVTRLWWLNGCPTGFRPLPWSRKCCNYGKTHDHCGADWDDGDVWGVDGTESKCMQDRDNREANECGRDLSPRWW